jgi:hypothetical protein
MAGAQLVYDDMGGADDFLDLVDVPQAQQLSDAADLFIFLGGNMDTLTWTTNEKQRTAALIQYYTLQGGVFWPL